MPRSTALLLAFCWAALLAPAGAAATSRSAGKSQPPPASADAWPQLLHDNAHTSVSSDQLPSAATASTVGLNWMSAMRSADVGSPVAAFNATLNKTVVYVGDERGDVIAFDESNGATLWSTSIGIGDSERASPLVAPDGSVWVGTAEQSSVFKLDGATGAVLCKLDAGRHINSSLMLATPPGGVETVYTATNHSPIANGREIAIRESDCTLSWGFEKWLTLSGAWATPAFGVDTSGFGIVFVGTADPDSTMYALDSRTGQSKWHFSALNPPDGEFDIGAAATVSPPGTNGFADGVLYFPSKYGVMYALDLATGKQIWAYNFNKAAHANGGGRAAAALYKNMLVYGMANGVEAVNATTGKLLWHTLDPTHQEVLSSPAIAGPSGNEVVTFGDVSGLVNVLRLSDGKLLYRYQTGNYITSSPAIVNGHIIIASSDGFLYDFTTDGNNAAVPTTAITSPTTGSSVPNPGPALTISGTATGAGGTGVAAVQVSVQRAGPTGPWYDAATSSWLAGPVNNFVAVTNPGQQQSGWTFSLPVLPSGSTYQVFANTISSLSQVDRVGAQSSFTVQPNGQAPQLTLSTALAAPTSVFTASGGPFGAGETVDFVLQTVTVAKAKANQNGMIENLKIAVPGSAVFGPSAVLATGETSHDATSAPIDITNIWSQSGYNTLKTGYEPNDTVLGDTLQSTNKGYLSRSWLYETGAAVEAPPAVVGASAYVGNTMGALSAVDTASGNPFWTYVIPSSAAIHGAPAVGNGDVAFGADDGTIYILSSVSGTPLGSVALDGVPTSPTLISGTLYVGTDNGTVYAIDEATGTELWGTPVGAAIHDSPVVDIPNGELIVGDDAGNVTTLNPTTGAKIRQVSTGGAAVTAGPIVGAASVLVGASDGFLRTYNEKTDRLVWKYNANSPIHALATTGLSAYVGSDNGKVAKLTLGGGSVVSLTSGFGSEIVGIAHSFNVSVATTLKGDLDAMKDDQNGRIQYTYKTGAGLGTQPAIVDGTVFVGAGDGGLYTFTSHGQAPQGAIEHRMLLQFRKQEKTPRGWEQPHVVLRASNPVVAFAPHGQRDFPIHLDRAKAPQLLPSATSGAGTRTYVLGWAPVAIRAAAYVERTRAAGGAIAGSAVDTTGYPRPLDDAAIQRELSRVILANGWPAGPGTRFLVLTGGAPVSAIEYCSYHSAFYLNGTLSAPVIYGVIPAGTTDECGAFGAQVGRAWSELQLDPFARAR